MPRKLPPGREIGPLRLPDMPETPVPWEIIKESERRRKGGYDITQIPVDQPEIGHEPPPPPKDKDKDGEGGSITWQMRSKGTSEPGKGGGMGGLS